MVEVLAHPSTLLVFLEYRTEERTQRDESVEGERVKMDKRRDTRPPPKLAYGARFLVRIVSGGCAEKTTIWDAGCRTEIERCLDQKNAFSYPNLSILFSFSFITTVKSTSVSLVSPFSFLHDCLTVS